MTNKNKEEDTPFLVQVYRKQELAMKYFPDLSKDAATRNLRRWIENCDELHVALLEVGYNKHRKFYLKREVQLIVTYLGEP